MHTRLAGPIPLGMAFCFPWENPNPRTFSSSLGSSPSRQTPGMSHLMLALLLSCWNDLTPPALCPCGQSGCLHSAALNPVIGEVCVSWGCGNKMPRTAGLRTKGANLVPVLKAGSQNQGVDRPHTLLKTEGTVLPCLPAPRGSGGLWRSLACGHTPPVSASTSTGSDDPSCRPPFAFSCKTPVTGFRAHLGSPG